MSQVKERCGACGRVAVLAFDGTCKDVAACDAEHFRRSHGDEFAFKSYSTTGELPPMDDMISAMRRIVSEMPTDC